MSKKVEAKSENLYDERAEIGSAQAFESAQKQEIKMKSFVVTNLISVGNIRGGRLVSRR